MLEVWCDITHEVFNQSLATHKVFYIHRPTNGSKGWSPNHPKVIQPNAQVSVVKRQKKTKKESSNRSIIVLRLPASCRPPHATARSNRPSGPAPNQVCSLPLRDRYSTSLRQSTSSHLAHIIYQRPVTATAMARALGHHRSVSPRLLLPSSGSRMIKSAERTSNRSGVSAPSL